MLRIFALDQIRMRGASDSQVSGRSPRFERKELKTENKFIRLNNKKQLIDFALNRRQKIASVRILMQFALHCAARTPTVHRSHCHCVPAHMSNNLINQFFGWKERDVYSTTNWLRWLALVDSAVCWIVFGFEDTKLRLTLHECVICARPSAHIIATISSSLQNRGWKTFVKRLNFFTVRSGIELI